MPIDRNVLTSGGPAAGAAGGLPSAAWPRQDPSGPGRSREARPARRGRPTGFAPVVVAVLFVGDLFLPWTRQCVTLETGIGRFISCGTTSGWSGLGAMAGILAAAAGLWISLWMARSASRPARDRMVLVVLTLAVLGLTVVEVALDRVVLAFGAWVGLALGVAMVASVALARPPLEAES